MENNDELMHYGVLGMKWGKRKSLPVSETRARYNSTKKDLKKARRQYSSDFNRAYNRNNPYSLSKKRRQASRERWEKAADSASKLQDAKQAHKEARLERKNAINKTYKKIQKKATIGEKILWNNATRKKAAKYVVDNNMSVADAKNKASGEAIRNTTAMLAVIGGYSIYNYMKNR